MIGSLNPAQLLILGKFEALDQLLKQPCLRGKLLAGGGRLFTGGRVGVYYSSNLIDSLRDLRQGSSFIFHSCGNLVHITHSLPCQVGCLMQCLSYLVHDIATAVDRTDGAFDQVLGGLGCLIGLGSQVAYLVSDNGKASAGRSGTGSFDRCVQCKNIGLESNVSIVAMIFRIS